MLWPVSTWAFLGDSVTAAGRDRARADDLGRGWVADVARRLRRVDPAARVVNLGVPGDRLADVDARALDDLGRAGALGPGTVVTLAVGVNDVRRAHLDAVPSALDGFAARLADLLDRVDAAAPGARLLLVEPVLTPFDAGQQAWVDDLGRVVDVLRAEAGRRPAALVPARAALARLPAREATKDGFHPTAAGHRVLAEQWWATARDAGLVASRRPRWWDRFRRP